jgi:hypothetical protein
MTATTRTAFRIHAVPEAVFEDARATRRDTFGNAIVDVTAGGGEPMRCCLRDATAGEQLILFGYEAPMPASPYRETGAIFGHAEPCDGPPPAETYPPDWRDRAQVIRAYDERGWIHAAAHHDGRHPEAAIEELLADPAVVQVHSRNVTYGCFMFSVTRAS